MKALCVSITESDPTAARRALHQAADEGAMAEVRLDCLESGEPLAPEKLAPLLEGAPTEVIVTFRRPRDGGRRALDDGARLALVTETARRFGLLFDLESDLADRFEAFGVEPERLVLSHHDFESTTELDRLYDEMTRTPAAVYKIATRARSDSDVVAHFELLERARRDGRKLVTLAMGAKGLPTRLLGPAFGAAFSFCALGRGRESAPGQATLREMREVYRADRATLETTVTGLVAARIDYSLSPAMHNAGFAELGLDGMYIPFEVDALGPFVDRVLRPSTRRVGWRLRGVSITNPHKTEIVRFLDHVDRVAQGVGAANTVDVEADRLVGRNTDVDGAMRPLERLLGDVKGATAGVLGAGGAARAVVFGLADRGARVLVFARSPERARDLGERFGVAVQPLEAVGIERLDLLVNTTPLGTTGPAEDETPVPGDRLNGIGLVYDLVYNPRETRLLREARAAGCRTLDGLPMLAEQAALQFELWTGRSIARRLLLEAAEAELTRRAAEGR